MTYNAVCCSMSSLNSPIYFLKITLDKHTSEAYLERSQAYVLLYREIQEKNCASLFKAITECVPLTTSFHLYFLCISKVWSMLHQGSLGQVQHKECYFIFTYTFMNIKKFVFLSFSFLFLMKYQISATKH